MAIKNATIRLPEELIEWLTSDGKSINQAVIECAQNLRRVRMVSAGELRGVFTPEEWKFLADSLNGTSVSESFRCNVSALVAHVEDAAQLEDLDRKWQVDVEAFTQKIKTLHGANVEALYSRVEEYWANSDTTDLNDWATF
nr:MAG TPA: Putative antitoxin [Caudoviricetes sp.]